MALLIDGYNLLHATNIFGDDPATHSGGAGSFQRSREALIAFLAASLTDAERAATTIVFDAAGAPPGLPNNYTVEGITVLYARDYPDADTLIEELIEDATAPRGLLVVSSDHRVQRAARRRGAKSVDSDRWHTDLWQRRVELRRSQQKSTPEKPMGQLSKAEIAYWVEQFDREELPKLPPAKPRKKDDQPPTFENPFPPGYADDLLEDEGDKL